MSVPVEMSDREALGDGEEVRVTTDGDLACRSRENIDANRDLALWASQPGTIIHLYADFFQGRAMNGGKIRELKGNGIGKKTKRIGWSDQKVKKALGWTLVEV